MAQKEENKPVPKEVIKAHSAYSPEGHWKGTESRIKWTRHLPDNVQTGWINSGYADWYVHNIKKIETPERPLYVLHVNNGTTLSSDKYHFKNP